MSITLVEADNAPDNYPVKSTGKFSFKVIAKKDYIRIDGTCALYIQIFHNGKRKRIPLGINVKLSSFDEKKQLIKGRSEIAKDYNLIIGNKLADINKISVSYRLSETYLSLEKLIEELTNPNSKSDFIIFYDQELKKQKGLIKDSTYNQQKSTLKKLKEYKQKIFFQEINADFINEFKIYSKKILKNQDITLESSLKNLKKFLNIAYSKGIKTPLNPKDLKIKRHKGSRVFLNEAEIKKLYEYRESIFINDDNKNILDRFLFSCFTGIRISDIQNLLPENLSEDFLFFKSQKNGKFQKIRLGKSALKFINRRTVFKGSYTDQFINERLKIIAKACDIGKHLTFHVSRHSFATNYLIKGGRVENLQKLLAHSSITDTMVYVHIVDSLVDDEIINLDSILM